MIKLKTKAREMSRPIRKIYIFIYCNLLLLLSVVLLLFISTSPAQVSSPLLQIISPADRAFVSPGQTISVVVAPAPNTSWVGVFVVGEDPLGTTDSSTVQPFKFSITIPADIRPKDYGLTAFGRLTNGSRAQSPSITIRVKNRLPLINLHAEMSTINFSFVGEQFPLLITGTFTHSSEADITQAPDTTFASDNAGVVAVNAAGLVTAVGPGSARIIIRNSDKSIIVLVSVPSTIRGDLDGDGDVDQDDLNIILDSIGQPAVRPVDARDLDSDGIIDLRDAVALKALCTRDCANLNIPPDISQAQPSPSTLWPPDHRMISVSIRRVNDPDGDPFTLAINSVRQDEPTSGLGDGDLCPDAQGIGTSSVQLRAERSGTGVGRVYTIFFAAKDRRGGESRSTVQVCVPHDQNGTCEFIGLHSKPALDSTVCPH